MMHGIGFSLTHAVMVLTVSFFVLMVVQKLEAQWLKVFGHVVAVLLWISAAFLFVGGVSSSPRGEFARNKARGTFMHGQAGKMSRGEHMRPDRAKTFHDRSFKMDGVMEEDFVNAEAASQPDGTK